MPPSKLSDEQKAEVVKRHQAGEGSTTLAREYGVTAQTILKYVRDAKEVESEPLLGFRQAKEELSKEDAEALGKRIRKTLWLKEHGKVKKMHDHWSALTKEYRKHGGLSYGQAIVEAAKEFPCLEGLVHEYTVTKDQLPGWKESVQVEGRELSHRENLYWAIDAAGRHQRTGKAPESSPNDSAFYLYRLAMDSPKDFLGKFTQIEARGDSEQEEQQQMRKRGQRAINEINDMLDTLREES